MEYTCSDSWEGEKKNSETGKDEREEIYGETEKSRESASKELHQAARADGNCHHVLLPLKTKSKIKSLRLFRGRLVATTSSS